MSLVRTRSSANEVIEYNPELERFLATVRRKNRERNRAQGFELEPEDLIQLFEEEARAMAVEPKKTLRSAIAATQRAMPMAIVLSEVAEDEYVEKQAWVD